MVFTQHVMHHSQTKVLAVTACNTELNGQYTMANPCCLQKLHIVDKLYMGINPKSSTLNPKNMVDEVCMGIK